MKKLLILLIVVFALFGAAAYWFNPSHAGTEETFTVAPAEWGTLVESVTATGNVQPREIVAVGSEASGKVVKIYPEADYGRHVDAGQALLQLDDRMANLTLDQAKVAVRLAEASVKQAEAQRNSAQAGLNHIKDLVKQEIGARGEEIKVRAALDLANRTLDAARIKVDEAREAVRRAQLGVDITTVRAPVAGVVIDKKVVLGQLIGPPVSAQLFTIASDLGQMQVNAQVAEGDVAKVRAGLEATFTLFAYSDSNEVFTGRVREVRQMPITVSQSPINVSQAIYYPTIIEVANRPDPRSKEAGAWMLRPGMSASVEIRSRQHKDVWKVPAEAVNFQLDEHYQTEQAREKLAQLDGRRDRDQWRVVWILKDKKPWPIFVRIGGHRPDGEPGIRDAQFYEVLELDSALERKPSPKDPGSIPQLIIAAPPASKPGLFDRPSLKLS